MLLPVLAGVRRACRSLPRVAGPAVLALCACSPTFNWRELRPEGTPLLALMPCKPESAVRPVPLGGAPTELHMHSCDTGGLTFAVAWADVGEQARVPEALARWRVATLASMRVDPALAGAPQTQWSAPVPGAERAQGLVAGGTGHDGRAVQARALYFARGAQVYQAAVYGPALPDAVVSIFFDGLRLP
ncbi:hypothetical protein [Hydrogenophaga taeniospiralis]|jgi:hypothetical protein|uniref:hypothetical protein n=1 Tax=Hydrogenophaga taeniospiralis TaxID=65656 RepID=UPI001CF9F74C|nr:hypothetical protein [Hydrogenophaga taeniospiralis]